jgi:hypothetical protein
LIPHWQRPHDIFYCIRVAGGRAMPDNGAEARDIDLIDTGGIGYDPVAVLEIESPDARPCLAAIGGVPGGGLESGGIHQIGVPRIHRNVINVPAEECRRSDPASRTFRHVGPPVHWRRSGLKTIPLCPDASFDCTLKTLKRCPMLVQMRTKTRPNPTSATVKYNKGQARMVKDRRMFHSARIVGVSTFAPRSHGRIWMPRFRCFTEMTCANSPSRRMNGDAVQGSLFPVI